MQQCPRGKYENAKDLMHEKEERNEMSDSEREVVVWSLPTRKE